MSHLLFWPTITYFYPVGNTSAVCLTENLAPESKADVLLLACGDPRHILYTVYANETNHSSCSRTFDITCCDVDVAILARNALLFTILADDGALDKLDSLWNIFYHMFVDKNSLSILFEQCRKLVPLAENAETWRAGPYGHFLTTCDAATLAEIRRVWTSYLDTASFSSKQAKRFEQRFFDGIKEMSRKAGSGGTTTAARSAGPLKLHAVETVSRQFSSYWSDGITDSVGSQSHGRKRDLTVNPMFAFSIDGDKFAVHYGTDPLIGFHLAEALASGKFTHLQEHIPPPDMVRNAKDQFSRWCTSVIRRLRGGDPSSPAFVIRMFGGDALTFCQALKYCEVTHSVVTPYNVAAWCLSTITLDDYYYGRQAPSRAPLSFNVIDTSNILDHVGLVNILVVTAPLLRKTASATLYTEALLRIGDNPSQAILEHVGGDLPTMALLLGIVPSTFISQFTTRSNVHETLTMDSGTKQFHERLAWKAIGLGGPGTQNEVLNGAPRPSKKLYFSPDELAVFLFRIYLHMFSDEDVGLRLQHLTLPPDDALRALQRSGVLHYNRRSFALFVHFVKTRVQTDWRCTMDLFEDLVLDDGRLMTGQHAYHELCCQLHLLGIYTTPCISIPSLHHFVHDATAYGNSDDDCLGLFQGWTQIPQIVTVVLVVPRDAISRLEPGFLDIGTPVLHCDMHDGPRQLWFAVTSATFGTLCVTGTGEHRTGVVVESVAADEPTTTSTRQPPWRTKAPMIITFSVPTISVMDFGQNPRATIGLALRPTMGATVKFASRLGCDLTVFRTRLTDAQNVFVLAQCPVPSTCKGKDAIRDTAGHWQEDIDMSRGPSHSEQATSGAIPPRTIADVRVQMNGSSSAAQSFIVRVDVTDPDARAALADTRTIPVVKSCSGCPRDLDASLRIGTYMHPVRFPLPVDVARAKLRIARRSSYVEVVAPLAPFEVRPERFISNRFASLSLVPEDDGAPTLGSIHRINLDQCPTFRLSTCPQTRHLNWYILHIIHMFSELEQRRTLRASGESPTTTDQDTPDTLTRVKRTLHLLLRDAAGAHPDTSQGPQRVFALFDTSRGKPYLYVVVAHTRVDVGSHTVVADAFVALDTPAVQEALCIALRGSTSASTGDSRMNRRPNDVPIKFIPTDADETRAWFHLLPRLTERCRTWPHETTCVYRTTLKGKQESGEHAIGTWERDSPLCNCGKGVGTEILPKEFRPVTPHLTRAAFSPLFSVPYLREVDVPLDPLTKEKRMPESVAGPARAQPNDEMNRVGTGHRCRSCAKEGGLRCSRCKRAQYCSKVCQLADWKVHKEDCRCLAIHTAEVVNGSDLAWNLGV